MPISSKENDYDTPLNALTQDMRAKLDIHDDELGMSWRSTPIPFLIMRMKQEILELEHEVGTPAHSAREARGRDLRIQDECADIANFVMFIHDIVRDDAALPPTEESDEADDS